MIARRTLPIVAWVLVGLVVVMVVVRAVTTDWIAAGDFAVMRMRTLDVGTSSTPLVGVYSRFGWNHPGPMMFYLYAPALRIAGGASWGLLLGAAFVNGAAIAAALWLARRAGQVAFLCVGFVLSAFVLGFGGAEIIDPWNPFVVILPLFAAAIAAWRCLFADRAAAIVLVVAVSFAIQGHVGSAVMAGSMFVIGAAGMVWAIWRGADRRSAINTALIAAGVLLVCWIPPIIDQLTNSPGNLRAVFSFFLHNDEQVSGIGGGLRIVSRALSLPIHLDAGFTMFPRDDGGIPFAALGLVAATWWSWRQSMRSPLAVCAVAWVSILAAIVGSSRVAGVPYPYLFRWVWACVAVTWVAILLVMAIELTERGWWKRWFDVVATAAISVLLLATFVKGTDMTALDGWSNEINAYMPVVDASLDALREVEAPTLLIITDSSVDGSIANELLLKADEQGIELDRAYSERYIFGSGRVIEPSSARSEMVIALKSSAERTASVPGYRLIIDYTPPADSGFTEPVSVFLRSP